MKVVINRCFGGFGLSNEAFELLLQRKGVEFERAPTRLGLRNDKWDYYAKGHVGEEEHFLWYYPFTEDRSDPDLIAVVELLGCKDAGGWASELMIVDIPDDVKWHVTEYDGWEHIAEDHRTWP